MKRILITGKNSYIGTSFKNWVQKDIVNYKVDDIDLNDGSWKAADFSQYDVIFHVAGIAHIKETSDNRELYYKVNRDLAFDCAQKAKLDGVSHFVFLSSMSVYGIEKGTIDKNTELRPNTAYGKSKMEAEELINNLDDELFTITTIRPPMVYGKGCKGNYPRLAALALKTPIFPSIDNKRSMIYIDNLSEFVKQLIDDRSGGLFFPQNFEYVNTSEMVRLIAEVHGKRVYTTKLFNPLLKILNTSMVNKVFGDLIYDMNMSDYERDYRICGLTESIENSEKG